MGFGEGIGDMFGALGHKRAGQRKDTAGEDYRNLMFLIANDYWRNYKGKKGDVVSSYAPYEAGGLEGENALRTSMKGDYDLFRNSPGYDYRMSESEKAINRNALAEGSYGGNRSRALVENAGNLADQDFQQYLANQEYLTSTGLNALGARTQLGEMYASGKANLMAGGAAGRVEAAFAAANELDAGYAQGGKAIQSGVQQIIAGVAGGMAGGSGGGMAGATSMLSSFEK